MSLESVTRPCQEPKSVDFAPRIGWLAGRNRLSMSGSETGEFEALELGWVLGTEFATGC